MYTIISTSPRCRPAPVTDTSVMNSKKWGNFVLAQHTPQSWQGQDSNQQSSEFKQGLFVNHLANCHLPGFCILFVGGWVCLHWGSSAPLQWWRRWVPFPSAAWWHSTTWTVVLRHSPVIWAERTSANMKNEILTSTEYKKTNKYSYLLLFIFYILLFVWNIIQTQSAHADQTPTLTLRNLWRRKANQFVSIFSATDSVLKWHEMRKKQGFSFMNPSIIHEIMTGSSGRSLWHLDTGFGCILFVEHSAHSE